MTDNKLQISLMFHDKTIVVVGGDTPEEFDANRRHMEKVYGITIHPPPIVQNKRIANPPSTKQPAASSPPTNNPSTLTGPRSAAAAGMTRILVESIEFKGGERWLVKGGPYRKHGVTMFEEVLVASGLFDQMSLKEVNKPATVWHAYYQVQENGAGKLVPDKVTKLVQAS